MFKVSNKDTRTCQYRCSGVSIVKFEHIFTFSAVFLVDFEQVNACCGEWILFQRQGKETRKDSSSFFKYYRKMNKQKHSDFVSFNHKSIHTIIIFSRICTLSIVSNWSLRLEHIENFTLEIPIVETGKHVRKDWSTHCVKSTVMIPGQRQSIIPLTDYFEKVPSKYLHEGITKTG